MPILYFDNYRGFQSTYLPLGDINFFVGENSTGKTSVLKLIGILSKPGFWRYQEFTTQEISLGNFSEILSFGSSKDFFEIGMTTEDTDNSVAAIKLKFIESENSPVLKEIAFINGRLNIQVSIDGYFLKYRYSFRSDGDFPSHSEIDFFKSWIDNNMLSDKPLIRQQVELVGILSILNELTFRVLSNHEMLTPEDNLKKFTPRFWEEIAWMAPIRSNPQKTYDDHRNTYDPEGKHSPYILKKILAEDDSGIIRHIIKKFGQDSGLFDDVIIKSLGDDHDKNAPFEILIVLDGKATNITNVGYGISQILPLLIELLARPRDSWFAIQQPEVHLHPRAQAALGDLFYKSHVIDGQRFVIETHSDYTIDRFRLRLSKAFKTKGKLPSLCQVVFFERSKSGNKLELIQIEEGGSYSNSQPKAFRDFFIREQLDLINI